MQTRIVVIRNKEGILQSWLYDASTYALFVALIGTGWLLGSVAMQWAGLIVGFTVVFSAVSASKPRTISEARVYLDGLEAEE